jgi:hypothetical protein
MSDIVNTGTAANNGTGDPLRSAMQKINNRFLQFEGNIDLNHRFQGAAGADPATRLTGDALQDGDWYFNSALTKYKVRVSGAWVVCPDIMAADLAAATGAAMVGDSQPLTNPKTVTQHTINRYRLYADQITGINPDGADCSAPLQTLVSEMLAAGYQELVFGNGTYTFANVNVPSKIQIIAQGRNTKFLKPASSAAGSHLLRFNGSVGAASALSADAALGSMTATVANGALFTANTYVVIRSNQYVSGSAGRRQEIKRVLSIATNTLTFSTPLFEGYTTAASSEVCILNPVIGAALHNVSLEGLNATGKGGLIKALYGIDLMLDEVHGQYFSDSAAFSLGTCLNATMQFCSAKDGINMPSMGYGYGMEFDEATTLSRAQDNYFENVRECTFTNRTRHSKFIRNICVNNYDTGFNTHGAYVTHCDVEDNQIIGTQTGSGITVGYGTHGAGDENISIRRNKIKNIAATGIAATAPSAKPNTKISIFDNTIENIGLSATAYGILGQELTKISTGNNRVEGVNNNVNSAIYFLNVTDAESNGDIIRSVPNGYGLSIEGSTNVSVREMSIAGVLSANVRGLGTNSNVRVHLKDRDDNSMSLNAGMSYTGREVSGSGTMTFAAETSKTAAITFDVPFPTGASHDQPHRSRSALRKYRRTAF